MSACQAAPARASPRSHTLVNSWYVIYRIMMEQPDRAVIYMADEAEEAFLIDPQGNVMSALASEHARLTAWARTNAWDPVLVADSVIPPEAFMPTLVLASPGRVLAQEAKNRVKTFGWKWRMPLPSCAELLDMHRVVFSHLSREDCIARMELWGPIPRLVFIVIDVHQQRIAWDELRMLNRDQIAAVLRSTLSDASNETKNPAPMCCRAVRRWQG